MEIIRLSNTISEVPLAKRLETLSELHTEFNQYSVHELCEALEVSRGTFYNHIFRKVDQGNRMQKHRELMMQVQQGVHWLNYHSVQEMKERLEKYVKFYNTERPHTTLGNRTPEAWEGLFSEGISPFGKPNRGFDS